jgi:hypothetical protein
MAEMGAGNNAAGLAALALAVKAREVAVSEYSLLNDRIWDPLRADARFQRLIEETNLARYQQH